MTEDSPSWPPAVWTNNLRPHHGRAYMAWSREITQWTWRSVFHPVAFPRSLPARRSTKIQAFNMCPTFATLHLFFTRNTLNYLVCHITKHGQKLTCFTWQLHGVLWSSLLGNLERYCCVQCWSSKLYTHYIALWHTHNKTCIFVRLVNRLLCVVPPRRRRLTVYIIMGERPLLVTTNPETTA